MLRSTGLALKRILDVIGAVVLLVALSPVMLWVAFLVWANLGRPIIFRNPRIGHRAATFSALKFRSMRDLFDAEGKPLPDVRRLTPFSNWLRKTSLDELPQLVNILKGEMSLIGPRPILTDFYPYLNPQELRRLDMRPGITGLAQVNGRNSLNWDARLEMDVWYVDNWSLWMDVKIALKTLPVWLGAKGITTPGFATFERLDECRRPAAEQPLEAPALLDGH